MFICEELVGGLLRSCTFSHASVLYRRTHKCKTSDDVAATCVTQPCRSTQPLACCSRRENLRRRPATPAEHAENDLCHWRIIVCQDRKHTLSMARCAPRASHCKQPGQRLPAEPVQWLAAKSQCTTGLDGGLAESHHRSCYPSKDIQNKYNFVDLQVDEKQ